MRTSPPPAHAQASVHMHAHAHTHTHPSTRPTPLPVQVWSAEPNGHRYNRWWNEEHYGDGRVRRYGDSTGGEHWDAIEHMDTYYNPIPHFG